MDYHKLSNRSFAASVTQQNHDQYHNLHSVDEDMNEMEMSYDNRPQAHLQPENPNAKT